MRATSASPGRSAGRRPGASDIGWLPPDLGCSSRRPRGGRLPLGAPGPARLNLFVWLLVTGYLVWGCRPSYRAARARAHAARRGAAPAVSYLAGGLPRIPARRLLDRFPRRCTSAWCSRRSPASPSSAGLAGVYLWQERRLKRREAGDPAPPAAGAASHSTSSPRRRSWSRCRRSRSGSRSGFGRLSKRGGGLDALMAGDAAHLDACTPRCSSSATALAGADGASPTSSSRVRARRHRPPGLPASTSHEPRPRRHVAPPAPVEVRERVALDGDAAAARRQSSRARATRPSASRPATARSSTSWRRAAEARAEAALTELAGGEIGPVSTASTTRRRRSMRSASPPGSTRWCPARARSSARCAPPTRPA